MPELPEVETITRALRDGGQGGVSLLGCHFISVQINWERSVEMPSVEELEQRLIGRSIVDIGRRGKFIIFSLDSDWLIFHLRMSGDLRVEPWKSDDHKLKPLGPYDRAAFQFSEGARLVFEDTRKFGRIWLVDSLDKVMKQLGPEPLDPSLTSEDFYRRLKSRHRQIKPLLMDQSFLAGLGNIYTDEALYLARIHPLKRSDLLEFQEAELLLSAIRHVLQQGIQSNGASIDWVYKGGSFQNTLQVYQRTGESCRRCGTPIKRIVVGQRGTHFCPVCQLLDPD
jgi:formamidopyrimidine-DNA glycosylase